MRLQWRRFESFVEARRSFSNKSCIYVQTDRSGTPIRIGKASKGLMARYRGGTGYALEAAMHDSGNLIFVAFVPAAKCAAAEAELIWRGRSVLRFNNQGKRLTPPRRCHVVHSGKVPRFQDFEAGS